MEKQKKPPMLSRRSGRKNPKITEDSPLSPIEEEFIKQYMECGNYTEAIRRADPNEVERTDLAYRTLACKMLKQPNVKKEFDRIMEEIKSEAVATADEVMTYLTSVMRGEVKDQFGLEAPLSERTKAALEIAKRTVDIDNKVRLQKELEENQKPIQVTLNWSKPDE